MHQTIGIINGEVDSTIPIKETETELIIPAILAREGVLAYAKGNMLRSREELQDSLFTFNKAWVTAEKHPEPLISIITDRKKQIKGDLTEVRLDADAVMPNGKKSAAVKANVHLIKKTLTPQFIDDVKTGRRRDVSVGFLFDTVDKKGNWQGEPYDFVQENILINHVAVGVPMGRMRAPFIGLGCDQADFEVADNILPQVEQPKLHDLEETAKRAKAYAADAQYGADPETTANYIRIPVVDCVPTATIDISAGQGIKALYCGAEKKIRTYLFDKTKWDMAKAQAWVDSHKADAADEADSTWDYAYVQALPDSAFGFVEPNGDRHLPFKDSSGKIDRAHLAAALAALGGARQAGPPPYADKAKSKLCAAVRQWNKENPNDKMSSTICDITADSADCAGLPVIHQPQPQPEPSSFVLKPSDIALPPTDQRTGALVSKLNSFNTEQLQRKRRNPPV